MMTAWMNIGTTARLMPSSIAFALAGTLMLGVIATSVAGQTTPTNPPTPVKPVEATDQEPYIAVVNGMDVYIRCGAAESYYPFAKANEGDLVKVTGAKPDWARITTIGPAFRDAYGYVKHAKGDSTRFRLSADGKTGTTLGKTEIIAPNMDLKSLPKDSWKSLVRIDANQTLRVIETTSIENETIHKVVLPESASGWISAAYLSPASESQAAQFDEIVEEMKRTAAQPKKGAGGSPVLGSEAPNANDVKPIDDPAATPTETPIVEPVAEETTPVDLVPVTPAPATTQPVKEKGPPTIDDLEGLYKLLQKEPIETAEVAPLREQYIELGKREPKMARRCAARIEQLNTWEEVQKKKHELAALRTRMKEGADETAKAHAALIQSAEYTAVGVVASSTVYDGQSLPKLLRLQDPATNRTIAYLKPDEEFKLVNLIGNLVGVVGEKTYDGSLRLNIIEPKRTDVLQPEQR
jgi:hypothetical protein